MSRDGITTHNDLSHHPDQRRHEPITTSITARTPRYAPVQRTVRGVCAERRPLCRLHRGRARLHRGCTGVCNRTTAGRHWTEHRTRTGRHRTAGGLEGFFCPVAVRLECPASYPAGILPFRRTDPAETLPGPCLSRAGSTMTLPRSGRVPGRVDLRKGRVGAGFRAPSLPCYARCYEAAT